MSTSYNPTLPQRVDLLIEECRRRRATPRMEEVEKLYTDGCAEALVLEAELRRAKRRLAAPGTAGGDAAPRAVEVGGSAERCERLRGELDAVRSQLRQLRAALEWAQSGAEIEQLMSLDRHAGDNGQPPG